MNKKAIIFASFCALGLCAWATQAITSETMPVIIINEANDLPNEYEQIILQGDLLYGIGPNAIEAGTSDNTVYIQFNQNCSNVSISIYNGFGAVVYSTVVDTSVQQTVIIPFNAAASDSYTIVIENASGSVEGDFNKN